MLSGKRIRESLGGWIDPAGADKDRLEAEIEMALLQYWQGQQQRIAGALEERVPENRKGIQLPLPFWNDEGRRLLSILLPFLARGAEGGVSVHRAAILRTGMDVDWTLPFTEAADWAREYAGELIKGITDTTRQRVRSIVGNWIETEHTLPDLIRQISGIREDGTEEYVFSKARARLIAVTESTRSYAEGELTAARELEKASVFTYKKIWESIPDGHRCWICESLQGQTVEGIKNQFDTPVGKLDGPPAHPGCRCAVDTVPIVPGVTDE